VLTELHTSLQGNKTIALAIDTSDVMLLRLIESVRFDHPDNLGFDHGVKYDCAVVQLLQEEYAKGQSQTRVDRYPGQVRDFMTTLPRYLGVLSERRIMMPALAFPSPPEAWSGDIGLAPLTELVQRLPAHL